jgi:hypothetical protein
MAHYINYLMVNNHQGDFSTLDQMNIISIFIDGAHLDNLGRMCVEPVIMELLALSRKVRHTYISKVLLGFLPPYPLLTAKKKGIQKQKDQIQPLRVLSQSLENCP